MRPRPAVLCRALSKPAVLLAAHDEQVRGSIERRMPSSWRGQREGSILLVRAPHRGFVFSEGLTGASDNEVQGYVARASAFFAQHGESVEWKTYGHDHPALIGALQAAGFEPEPAETVLVAPSAVLASPTPMPDGVTVRVVTGARDLARIADLESQVWGTDWSWLAGDLASRIESDPAAITVYVAEVDGHLVSVGWLVVLAATSFAGLWGGSTLEPWRRRGIYRALVEHRAREAVERGIGYLWVDASDASRPILEGLGMTVVATTTPWIRTPPGSLGAG